MQEQCDNAVLASGPVDKDRYQYQDPNSSQCSDTAENGTADEQADPRFVIVGCHR